MAPLIVMLACWLVARSVGTTGLWQADSWAGALRIALAAMFVFTAVSHFHPRTRPDLIRMDVKERQALTLREARPVKAGAVWLHYRVPRRQRGPAAEG
jgi:hypothetical protein